MIYLDTAASYPLLPEAKSALIEALDSEYANSASSHSLGVHAFESIESVRGILAKAIGAERSEIIFTSGATESNNIAFKSFLLGVINSDKKHIITSLIEHKCILSICNYFETLGYEVTYLKPNGQGVIEAESVKKAIRKDTALVSIMHVNNELGTINPIGEIGALCLDEDVLFHSDAAQSFGKVEINVEDLNVDIMSFSAHKIGGPKGIGAIYIRDLRKHLKKLELAPVIHGAGQEVGIRGGTVASPLIAGFGKAIELFPSYYEKFKCIQAKSYLIEQLKLNNIVYQINGSGSVLESCISLTLPDIIPKLLNKVEDSNLCLAQGSACSSKDQKASHVLSAIGLNRDSGEHTFRISFPLDIKTEDIDFLVKEICKVTPNSNLAVK